MANQSPSAKTRLKTHLRQLRGFARTGFTGHNYYLMRSNGLYNFLFFKKDRQIFLVN